MNMDEVMIGAMYMIRVFEGARALAESCLPVLVLVPRAFRAGLWITGTVP
jgi:hypothetical protein